MPNAHWQKVSCSVIAQLYVIHKTITVLSVNAECTWKEGHTYVTQQMFETTVEQCLGAEHTEKLTWLKSFVPKWPQNVV